jgi:FkbM family methyltransferase
MTSAKQGIKAVLRRTLPPTAGSTGVERIVRSVRDRAYRTPILRSPGFYSQDGQDQAVVELFGARRGGVFLDIGAHDGVSYSNTFYLEKELGWTGICIEPHPGVFSRLREHRHCTCENVAVASSPRTAKFMCVSGYGEMLSRFSTGPVPNRITHAIETTGAELQEIEVPCDTVLDILTRNDLTHVDYISIDVEGCEFEILQTIDLRSLDVRVLTIENNYPDDRVELYLRRQGYNLMQILGQDGVYKRHK